MTRTWFHRAPVATVHGPPVALSNVSVQAQTPETHGQLIAAARLVGVSDSASNKQPFHEEYRNGPADLETDFHLDGYAPPPAPALVTVGSIQPGIDYGEAIK